MNETVKRRFPRSLLCMMLACVMLFSGFAPTAYAVMQESTLPVTVSADAQGSSLPLAVSDSQEQAGDVIVPFGLINYNVTQQLITGVGDRGAFGGFNKDLRQDIYYSAQHCWQRNFGYCKFYDNAAPYFFMNFECLRFYFDYAGKSWLIQAWKGQYGVTTGCEVGVYYKNENSSSQLYHAVEDKDRLPMSVTLYYKGSQMFYRPMETTWWQTGFRLFKLYHSDVLGMKFAIDLKNQTMPKAFLGSITDDMRITYKVTGTTVNVNWDI
ncbi:MAG: DUF4474 domain-containing protein [Clostridia bacterium]|nr:DUF4474 domain-containing protein [Clostridia bacterium]